MIVVREKGGGFSCYIGNPKLFKSATSKETEERLRRYRLSMGKFVYEDGIYYPKWVSNVMAAGHRSVIHASGIIVMGSDCTIYGDECVVLGDRCTVYGRRCVVYGNDCKIWGNMCNVHGEFAHVRGVVNRMTSKTYHLDGGVIIHAYNGSAEANPVFSDIVISKNFVVYF